MNLELKNMNSLKKKEFYFSGLITSYDLNFERFKV
jgi:hypothetical protein